MILNKIEIISGGQSGVDRAALDFALKYGIKCKGWCPKGRLSEDGVIPIRYPLKEASTSDYNQRTSLNVQVCDGTLIIIIDKPDLGTTNTIDYVRYFNKPLTTINISHLETDYKYTLFSWLAIHNIVNLNIAGPRESSSPGIYKAAFTILESLLED